MPGLLDGLSSVFPDEPGDRGRLGKAFGAQHYIYLSREDKVAQAVSLVLAKQTGLWHLNADGSIRQQSGKKSVPVYDQHAIAQELEMLEAEARGWADWFEREQIKPVDLSYEQLASDPIGALQSILQGIDCGEGRQSIKVNTAQTRSEINQQWIERFKTESDSNSQGA